MSRSRRAPIRTPEPAAARAAAVPLGASAALALAWLVAILPLVAGATADGDAAELTLVLAKAGVAHPTGYPLWTLLGHLFVVALRVAGVGTVRAANAWAAATGALALFLLHRLGLALLPVRSPLGAWARGALAALPVLVLALHPQWLADCTSLEVYSAHVAWVCGASLLFVRLVRELDTGAASFPLVPRMLAWGFVCGMGGAHHATAAFVAAGETAVLGWALVRARRLAPLVPLLWLAGGLVPLTSYLALLVRARHPDVAVWAALTPTWRGLAEHVTASVYHGFVGGFRPSPEDAATLAHDVYPFLWPALALLAARTIAVRAQAERLATAGLLAAAALSLAFVYAYGVPDPASYFLAPLALALAALGAVAHALLVRARPALRVALAGVACALLVPLGAWGVRATLARDAEIAHYDALIRSMWRAVPVERGILLWASDSHAKLDCYRVLEGERAGVEVDDAAMLCKPAVAAAFRARWDFDPLANNGEAHAGDAIEPRYFGEHHAILGDRFLARINETIADSARVPVLLFDGAAMKLRWLNRPRPVRAAR